MARIYYDADVDLSILYGKKIAVIGFGNQGRSHALNLRDSGQEVMIGNINDDYANEAKKEGFPVRSIGDATKDADIICMLVRCLGSLIETLP